ncbi:helix-turn-helix domain-containing protein [Mucilaginibacter sp. JRF]|uniref:AraC family transcriptional regulator n=1 Tax=Mucilaginibacter sp. JRF TaxID=2780088 RepID=UPI00187EDFEB|nr:AraC family transcriptional regulator [Mucilaginibacter sp. JRF]MBE9586385.1 helix-turn-helix domain-containing protein [Mucilaginibacter sp. JRF]
MKVLQFTIPVAHDKSVITDQVELPYHYPHLHRHKEAQLTWVQKGEGTLIAGNNMHAYTAGEIYYIGPNLPHLFKSNPDYFKSEDHRPVKALTVFFNPDGILSSMFELPELRPVKQFLNQHTQGFKIPVANCDAIAAIMMQVREASGSKKLLHFLELMQGMVAVEGKPEALSTHGNLPSMAENEGIRIGNIYNYIMQNYNGAITLDDVARAACMTSESFCRYFKKHTGHTFVSFLNEVRVNEACKRLTSHKFENVSEIAFKCGFKSITNFNRVFKSVTGNSPREYLDNYLNNINNLSQTA